MDLAIEISDLTKRYGSLTAVNKPNLEVKRNTVHGFLSPNGAGKTTTIKILVGLLTPNEGIVKVLDQELHGGTNQSVLQSFYEKADSRWAATHNSSICLNRIHILGTLRSAAIATTYTIVFLIIAWIKFKRTQVLE